MNESVYKVSWTRKAKRDLEDIIYFIAQDSLVNARKILDRLNKKASSLDKHPWRGRIVPELSRGGYESCRELIVKPYRIFYKVHEHKVHVISVLDSRRDLEDLLLERLLREGE